MNPLLKIWKIKDLRGKILFVIFMLVLYRILSVVPVPTTSAKAVVDAVLAQGGLGGVFDILELISGGALSQFSLVAMGVGPYITSSIIIQLLTKAVPQLSALSKEGEFGREKINQYTRIATVPIALVQGFSVVNLLKQFAAQFNVPFTPTFAEWIIILVSMTAGTILTMWIGELITEKGIGNGISLIIFTGIVARLVPSVVQAYQASQGDQTFLFNGLLFGGAAFLVVGAVIFVTEGTRNLPISYARAIRGQKTYQSVQTHLPLKVNMSGVIPIIFAVAVVSAPQSIAQLMSGAKNAALVDFGNSLNRIFSSTGNVYWIVYFALVIAFTFFSTYLYFHPKEVSENIQKQGGYIPGIRPGTETSQYLSYIINRISLFGAVFLGLIAVLPFIVQKANLGGLSEQQSLAIGGTGLLIAVSVVIETVRSVQAQLLLLTYEKS